MMKITVWLTFLGYFTLGVEVSRS